MRVRFLELAQYELDDPFVWYEEQMPGLGLELLNEVDRSIRLLPAGPWQEKNWLRMFDVVWSNVSRMESFMELRKIRSRSCPSPMHRKLFTG